MTVPAAAVKLEIMLDEAGNVAVNGPIGNRMLCYGMIEMAKEAINKFNVDQQKRIVEVPPGTQLKPLPGGKLG